MLTPEEDVEIASLKKRGWSISAIARHTGRDRKTVRAYLNGEREPGVRAKAEPDRFDRFEPYVRQRLADDPHVRATVLFDEVVALGFERSYQTFTRQVRDRELRPHCEPCASSNGQVECDVHGVGHRRCSHLFNEPEKKPTTPRRTTNRLTRSRPIVRLLPHERGANNR